MLTSSEDGELFGKEQPCSLIVRGMRGESLPFVQVITSLRWDRHAALYRAEVRRRVVASADPNGRLPKASTAGLRKLLSASTWKPGTESS